MNSEFNEDKLAYNYVYMQLTLWRQQSHTPEVIDSETMFFFSLEAERAVFFSSFRGSWEKQRQAAAKLTAAANAAVTPPLWMRELSDKWWELLVGAGDLLVNAVMFLSFGFPLPFKRKHIKTRHCLHLHLQDSCWRPVRMGARLLPHSLHLVMRCTFCTVVYVCIFPQITSEAEY